MNIQEQQQCKFLTLYWSATLLSDSLLSITRLTASVITSGGVFPLSVFRLYVLGMAQIVPENHWGKLLQPLSNG